MSAPPWMDDRGWDDRIASHVPVYLAPAAAQLPASALDKALASSLRASLRRRDVRLAPGQAPELRPHLLAGRLQAAQLVGVERTLAVLCPFHQLNQLTQGFILGELWRQRVSILSEGRPRLPGDTRTRAVALELVLRLRHRLDRPAAPR